MDASFPASAWEQVAFGKLAFDPSLFLIYEGEFGPLGFVHATTSNSMEASNDGTSIGLINAICVRSHPHQAEIASGLLEEVQRYLDRLECRTTFALGSPRLYAFYLGIGEGCGLLGVPENDHRTREWLTNAGYQETSRIDAWELDLQKFRVPMDRNQIAIRRTARVESLSEGNGGLSYAQSVLFGHAELYHFKLHHRDLSHLDLRAHFWRPEIPSSPNDVARNRFHLMFEAANHTEVADHYLFLLAEAFRQLQQLRGMSVRCTLERGVSPVNHSLLQRLGFAQRLAGSLYARQR